MFRRKPKYPPWSPPFGKPPSIKKAGAALATVGAAYFGLRYMHEKAKRHVYVDNMPPMLGKRVRADADAKIAAVERGRAEVPRAWQRGPDGGEFYLNAQNRKVYRKRTI